jgi:hypothetical protein
MWKFTGVKVSKGADGKPVREPVEPTVGIGPGPLEDADFEAAVERVEAQYGSDQRGVIKASGIYVHEKGAVTPQPESAPAAESAATEEAPR